MGILTTQSSARAFSTYVALFGLALLITSSIYLKDLNHWAEKHSCVDTITESDGKSRADILCSNYKMWRKAAIIGIIIGVVDVLVVPFLLCCGCCLVCGCTALICACVNCESSNSNDNTENRTTTTSATSDRNESQEMNEKASTTTTPITTTNNNVPSDPFSKFNLTNLPKPVVTILNVMGWTVWVLLPFIGSLLITIWIYKTDAIRTSDNKLYSSALAVFVCALLNLMVYYQKFIDSVCKSVCGRKDKNKKERKESARSEV